MSKQAQTKWKFTSHDESFSSHHYHFDWNNTQCIIFPDGSVCFAHIYLTKQALYRKKKKTQRAFLYSLWWVETDFFYPILAPKSLLSHNCKSLGSSFCCATSLTTVVASAPVPFLAQRVSWGVSAPIIFFTNVVLPTS